MTRRVAYRIPPGAGEMLATSSDYATVLGNLSSLVVDSGFADDCVIETCTHAEPDGASSRVPAFDAWVCSVMHAPLVARGVVIGTVAFYRFESSAPFREEDREIAEMIAWCVALVVDTAAEVRGLLVPSRTLAGSLNAILGTGEGTSAGDEKARSGARSRSGLHRALADHDVGRRPRLSRK